MRLNFLENTKHIHFIGINGASMSALAILLNEKGIKITGSDIEHIPIMDKMLSLGISIYIPHDASKVGKPDLVVYTAAIHSDNVEYAYAQKNNIPLMDRAVLLGHIMDQFKYSVAVSGAHGKTTTTTLTAYLMEMMGLDPTIHNGGDAPFLNNSNVKSGNSEYFITEACEFNDSFLKLNPYIAVMLNIDFDHVDWFGNFENMKAAFLEFTKKIVPGGWLVACYDDLPAREVAQKAQCNVLYYGEDNKDLDYCAYGIEMDEEGRPSFELYIKGKRICEVKLSAQGRHNALNSLAAIAVMDIFGADIIQAAQVLKQTHGAKRRFDLIGEAAGIRVYSDYAHHPKEIEVTLEAASNIKHNKLYAAFEAHTLSRVRVLFDEFVNSFKHADLAVIAEIYNDREKASTDISGKILADAVNESGTEALFLPNYQQIEDYLVSIAEPGDLIIVLGSKYLESICPSVVRRLEEKFLDSPLN